MFKKNRRKKMARGFPTLKKKEHKKTGEEKKTKEKAMSFFFLFWCFSAAIFDEDQVELEKFLY
jgi:hypothetical protein